MRSSDLVLQNSMIKFSQHLQENEKSKNEYDKKQSDEKSVRSLINSSNTLLVNRKSRS